MMFCLFSAWWFVLLVIFQCWSFLFCHVIFYDNFLLIVFFFHGRFWVFRIFFFCSVIYSTFLVLYITCALTTFIVLLYFGSVCPASSIPVWFQTKAAAGESASVPIEDASVPGNTPVAIAEVSSEEPPLPEGMMTHVNTLHFVSLFFHSFIYICIQGGTWFSRSATQAQSRFLTQKQEWQEGAFGRYLLFQTCILTKNSTLHARCAITRCTKGVRVFYHPLHGLLFMWPRVWANGHVRWEKKMATTVLWCHTPFCF